jgi:hypothetical protein
MTYGTNAARALALAAALAFGAGVHADAQAQHQHDHGAAAQAQALTLDAGKKWGTDEPLRRAMANIRAATQASLHGIHDATLPAARYDRLARTVEKEVASIVANCRLEPQADAQLHLIVADLVLGADAMAGKRKDLDRRRGALKTVDALQNYGDYFDDPGWKPLAH